MAYTVEVRCLELVARWLGEGHPTPGPGARDVSGCNAHMEILCAIRGAHTWDVMFTMQLRVWIEIGRGAWLRSLNLRAVTLQLHTQRSRDAQIQVLRSVEAGNVHRIRELEDEVGHLTDDTDRLEDELADLRARFIDMMDHAQGLEMELQQLRASRD
jgi:hypothetical protein